MIMFKGHDLTPSETERESKMSDVIWCDIGDPETDIKGQVGHPFSSKDINAQHFEQSQTVAVPTGNSYGQTTYQERQRVTQTLDICGYHWARQNPFQAPTDTAKALIDRTEVLGEQNEQWQAGYEAGTAHRHYAEEHKN